MITQAIDDPVKFQDNESLRGYKRVNAGAILEEGDLLYSYSAKEFRCFDTFNNGFKIYKAGITFITDGHFCIRRTIETEETTKTIEKPGKTKAIKQLSQAEFLDSMQTFTS